MRQTRSHEAALALAAKPAETMRIKTTGQWKSCVDVRRGPSQGVALAVAAKACNIVKVHRKLAYPSEEITQKTARAMGIATTGQWEFCEAHLQAKANRQAVQWFNGPGKTGSSGIGNGDLGEKLDKDKSVGRRGPPQLDVQDLELEQPPNRKKRTQNTLQDPVEETREAPSDPEEKSRETPPDPEEETRKAPVDPEAETQEAPLDPEAETQEAP